MFEIWAVSEMTSQYRGVYWDRDAGRFRAVLRKGNKRYYCGVHISERAAARAYDRKVRELGPPYLRYRADRDDIRTKLNFPLLR